MFTDKNALDGERLAGHILKTCQREDVNTALVALCMCIAQASRAAGIKTADLARMLQIFENTLNNGVLASAQAAMANAVVP